MCRPSRRRDVIGVEQYTYLTAQQFEQNGHALAVGHPFKEAEMGGEHAIEHANRITQAKAWPPLQPDKTALVLALFE